MKFINGKEMHELNPGTFDWPDLDEQAERIKIGCFVKVGVMVDNPREDDHWPNAERLWVEVTGFMRAYDRSYPDGSVTMIYGTFANQPVFFDAKYGDFVTFQPVNVLSIDYPQKID